MDNLEHYLDLVCRSIGGPRSLRQHVRQELREHLLDAAAGHRAAGLSEEEALRRAVDDFGGPDEVRAGLEEEYGHRLLPVLIDKAMLWKERTMRAKWLWATWAHLALAAVIVLEVVWVTFAAIFLIPKFEKLVYDGIIDPRVLEEAEVTWMAGFLGALDEFVNYHTPWLALAAIVLCGLFEWRVRSENKSIIRLSAWGTVAALLMVPAVLTAGALVVPYMLAAPAAQRIAKPFAARQIADVDSSITAMEQALAREDWAGIEKSAADAVTAVESLEAEGSALGTLASHEASVNDLRARLARAKAFLKDVRHAAQEQDATGVAVALAKFRESYEPVSRSAAEPK